MIYVLENDCFSIKYSPLFVWGQKHILCEGFLLETINNSISGITFSINCFHPSAWCPTLFRPKTSLIISVPISLCNLSQNRDLDQKLHSTNSEYSLLSNISELSEPIFVTHLKNLECLSWGIKKNSIESIRNSLNFRANNSIRAFRPLHIAL